MTHKNAPYALLFILFTFWASTTTAQKDSTVLDVKLMDSLFEKSYNLFSEGNYVKSFEINLRTLKLALLVKDDIYVSRAYGYLGYDYLNQGDTIEALKNFKLAHDVAKKIDDPSILANTYGDLSSIYFQNPKTQNLARKFTLKAIETYKATNDTLGLQYVYHNYADALNESGRFTEMKLVIDKLNGAMFDKYDEPIYRSSIHNMTANYYFHSGDYKKTDSLLQVAISLSKDLGFNDELQRAYELYSLSLTAQEKYKEAYETRLKYEKVFKLRAKEKAAIENNRLAAAFKNDQFKKDLEKSEAESVLQEKQIRTKTAFNYALICITVIAFLGLYFTFKLSKKRKQLNKALKEKNTQYLNQKTKTEQLALAKSDFFSTVSHELRTPLYGVIGLSTILLENNKEKDVEDDLKSLKFSADYLLALVNDVLQINKIDSHKIDEEEVQFNPRELIEKIVATFEYMRRQNKNNIAIHLADDLPALVKGNATRLSQILMNLIGNASKFTENGLIEITVTTHLLAENNIKLGFSIKDNGEGIAQDKKEHIFEEFKQGDSLSYNYQGTGLGLPIVKRLLNLSGSDINLETELGKGSTFSFDLIYEIIAHVNKREHLSKNSYVVDTDILKDTHILIAEDNRINQMVTKKILEKDGAICTIVENGKEAIKSVEHNTYDLILMDVNMPVMNGLDATKIIKKTYNTPIIALTAVEIAEMRQSILDSGMDDIIIKPYDVKVFKNVIINNILAKQIEFL
ncbi:response regulator [Nonlabens sp.]|uniref:response regulator n=1 Tax=Nonlabens sp. TaxID=1888209 RepID=UPI003264D6FD